jgi:hypothetical protein
MAAPVESVTVPRMRPVTVWAKMGTDASTSGTITLSTRMLFDVERITEPPTTEWKRVVRQLYHHTKMDVKEFWAFWGLLDWTLGVGGIVVGPILRPHARAGYLSTSRIYLSDGLED